ncbi:Transmembrane protein [Salix suchowensis]|nr:Transmembrane protein [Salix suchowensis]
MRPVWYPSVFRWREFGFSMPLSSIFRWPEFDFSYFTTRLSLESFRWLDFFIDDVLWTFVTVLESVALAALLCFFFVFCGCTL